MTEPPISHPAATLALKATSAWLYVAVVVADVCPQSIAGPHICRAR